MRCSGVTAGRRALRCASEMTRRLGLGLCCAVLAFGAAGCQHLASTELPGLADSHEKRLSRLAQQDAFPSPQDVGISPK